MSLNISEPIFQPTKIHEFFRQQACRPLHNGAVVEGGNFLTHLELGRKR